MELFYLGWKSKCLFLQKNRLYLTLISVGYNFTQQWTNISIPLPLLCLSIGFPYWPTGLAMYSFFFRALTYENFLWKWSILTIVWMHIVLLMYIQGCTRLSFPLFMKIGWQCLGRKYKSCCPIGKGVYKGLYSSRTDTAENEMSVIWYLNWYGRKIERYIFVSLRLLLITNCNASD